MTARVPPGAELLDFLGTLGVTGVYFTRWVPRNHRLIGQI